MPTISKELTQRLMAHLQVTMGDDNEPFEMLKELEGLLAQPESGGWYGAKDIDRMVREIDVALHGENAAPQAMLCDIVQTILERLALQPEQPAVEPVTYMRHVECGHAPDDYWVDLEFCDANTKDAFPVFTHPTPFTPITIDDVTDEMAKEFYASFVNGAGMDNASMIVAAVNAWGEQP